MGMEKFDMYAQLYESQKRFQRACNQIVHLNGKLEDLHKRYSKARTADDKCFRYNIRMRILIVEGMVKKYCDYAYMKKNEVFDLRFKLYGELPDEAENDEYNGERQTEEDE
ncbi:hypothetical protein ACF0H5_000858 [Mactra antiquata]